MHRLASMVASIAVFLLLASGSEVHAIECEKSVARPFKVFNGLFFDGQPDLSAYGMLPIHIIDRQIWAAGVARFGPPDQEMVNRYVERLPDDGAPIVLDFEDYDLAKDDAQAAYGIGKLKVILDAFRATGTKRDVGFYGYVPLVDYWRTVVPVGSAKYLEWQKQNERAAPLADNVDALFPSIYTYYPDEAQWVTNATAQICEARRLSSKPVYVFLWPHYHNQGKPLPPRAIPGKYWKRQLETVHRLADGVIIWGGWNESTAKKATWDADEQWWQETVTFLRKLQAQ